MVINRLDTQSKDYLEAYLWSKRISDPFLALNESFDSPKNKSTLHRILISVKMFPKVNAFD